MVCDAACATLDTNVAEVARRLAVTPTDAVVVIDTARRPIGIVTRSDMERAAEEADAPPLPPWLIKYKLPIAAIRPAPRPLSDVMTAPAIFVPDVAQLLEFAMLMERKRLERLPVVNHDGLVGLVRRADVLRALQDERPSGGPIAGAVTAKQFRDLATRAEALELSQREEARLRAHETQNELIEELARRRRGVERMRPDAIPGAALRRWRPRHQRARSALAAIAARRAPRYIRALATRIGPGGIRTRGADRKFSRRRSRRRRADPRLAPLSPTQYCCAACARSSAREAKRCAPFDVRTSTAPSENIT
jgi:CBS domain-containing protein